MFRFEKERNADFNFQYATRADYCRIFRHDMRPLYLLSFLLTTNHKRAEQCYAKGLENALNGIPVFREWARSWSRRTLIQNAIRVVFDESIHDEVRDAPYESPVSAVIEVVTRLAPLERFALVMCVLERYSARECSLMLNCTVQNVIDARSQALRILAGAHPLFLDAKAQSASQPVCWPTQL